MAAFGPVAGLSASFNFGFSMLRDFLGTVLTEEIEICLMGRLERLSSGCGVLGIREGISSSSKLSKLGEGERTQSGESGYWWCLEAARGVRSGEGRFCLSARGD